MSKALLAVVSALLTAIMLLFMLLACIGRPALATTDCGPAGVGMPVAGVPIDAEQMGNAHTIVGVVAARKLPVWAATVAVATAYQESGLVNLDHGDTAGPDSRGLFQQRPSQGWGTEAQVLDPVYATGAFLDALVQVPEWQTLPLTVAAQDVQHSGTPDAYAQWQTLASNLVGTLWPEVSGSAPPSAPAQPTAAPSAGASAPAGPRSVGKLSPAAGAYVGAYTGTDGLTTTEAIESYFQQREALAGRNFAIQNFMPGWNQPLASDLVKWDITQGVIPLISWNTPNGVSDASITNGSQDAWIKTEADGVKALSQTVFLRFDWEMNGNWFAWDGAHNGGPAAYVAMWRHVHDVFVAEGATNVAWVWTPSAQSLPDTPDNAMTAYYPGDDYVDWAGEDDYNYGGTAGHSGGWNDFTSQMQPLYNNFASRKPIMIGEMSSVDGVAGHDKGQWITTMAAQVKADYPDVQALVWFDTKYTDGDWRFDTSSNSLEAFRAWLADLYYNPSIAGGQSAALCPGAGGDGPVAGGGTTTTTMPSGMVITGTAAGIQAVHYALAQLGKPYVWGASGPNSFDCSGLTMAAWASAGVTLAHFTGDQAQVGTPEPTDLSQAQAGDLVFIPGSDGTATDPRHVGMVAGYTTDAASTRHLFLVQAPHTGADVELTESSVWAGRVVDVRHVG